MQIQRENVATVSDANKVSNANRETGTVLQPDPSSDARNYSQQQVDQSIKALQKHLEQVKDTSMQMEYNDEIDRVIVKFVHNSNHEVVSQIPSKKFVEFSKEFVKTCGLLFDQKM